MARNRLRRRPGPGAGLRNVAPVTPEVGRGHLAPRPPTRGDLHQCAPAGLRHLHRHRPRRRHRWRLGSGADRICVMRTENMLNQWLRVLVTPTTPHVTRGPTRRGAIPIDRSQPSIRAAGRRCTCPIGVVFAVKARSLRGWQACLTILENLVPTLRVDVLPKLPREAT